jgi:hypothetical protein
VDLKVGVDDTEKRKFFPLPGFELDLSVIQLCKT